MVHRCKTRTEISLFAFDSTGLKPTNRGDWMAEKWGVRRGFIKLHIGVDAKTKKIYAAVITDDKCGDSPQFEELVGQAFANAEKSPNVETSADTKVAADGAYDTRDIYNYCNKYEIEPLIPVRINFAGNANGCMSRKKAGFEQFGSFEHIDKKAEHEFAGLTRKEKKERQNGMAQGIRIQRQVDSRDCILYVQAGIRRVYKCTKMGKRQDGDIRKDTFVQSDDRYGN